MSKTKAPSSKRLKVKNTRINREKAKHRTFLLKRLERSGNCSAKKSTIIDRVKSAWPFRMFGNFRRL